MDTYEDQIKKMYEGQLNSQKEQLTTDYNSALSNLDAQKEQAQKAAQQSASQATARAQRAVVNNEEYYAANGLTSGARAQARLAQENQLQANLTNIQAAQQAADAEVERQRGLLSQEYASAIRKAQADNDMALAKALYEQAQKEEEKLLAKQEAAAALIAQTGDYSRLGALYGLTDEEVQKLNGNYRSGSGGGGGQNWDNEGYDKATIAKLQAALGFSGSDVDGLWGPNSRKAALERWGTSTLEGALEAYNDENSYVNLRGVKFRKDIEPIVNGFAELRDNGVSWNDRYEYLVSARDTGRITGGEFDKLFKLM